MEETIFRLRRTPATLLVEVGFPTAERPAIANPAQAALSTALSPRTTLLSLQTLGHSLGHTAGRTVNYPACTPLAANITDWTQADRSLRYSMSQFDTSAASLAQGRRNLLAMADRADAVCRRTGVRHRLVFFSLPAMPEGSPAHHREVQANTARIGRMFANRASASGGCEVRYRDLSSTPPGNAREQALWRDREQWSDYTHFRPRLGALALDALSREIVSPLAPR
ncbi:MAG: hypothetical protein EON85_16160 [Brevundimonas sp.]|nr:MAG: hypothetical protein EON85_16160 [Brevundimonas sp.]